MQIMTIKLEVNAIANNNEKDDPWLEPVEDYAVDAGIDDFSLNHDHYLYGVPKRTLFFLNFRHFSSFQI